MGSQTRKVHAGKCSRICIRIHKYEGFQWKEQTGAGAIDFEDAYNRVKFKLAMDLLMEYGVSLTLTQWIEKR